MKPPRRGPLYAVESHRINRGRRQRVTKLFRMRAAADRYADHQCELGREPVTVWTIDLPPWRLAERSW